MQITQIQWVRHQKVTSKSYPCTSKSYICSYLEVHKDTKETTIYYIEQRKKAIVSTYCEAGVCPTREMHQGNHCGSMQDMFLVKNDTNEAILGLLSEEIM